MPSSTSSSKSEPLFERLLPSLGRTPWLALLVAVLLMAGWETWVRSQGVTPGYRNSDGLWAEQRRRIDQGEGDATVIIGSSRALFDIQLGAWEKLDHHRPIQLALEGTSPVAVLEDLAEDVNFTGKLIVGVAPGLFFSGYEYRHDAFANFRKETPAQWSGQRLSLLVEPWLAFYDFDFALPAMLRRLPLRNRDGVQVRMEVRKLSNMGRDRNSRLWDKLSYDLDYQALARRIWAQAWLPLAQEPEPKRKHILEARGKQIERAVAATHKLQARGVPVTFAQMPYAGHYAISEPDIAPRALTWDPLIAQSGAIGLHFQDHAEMQGYTLPEWSHMSGAEADRFTAALYSLIQAQLAARQPVGAAR